MKRFLESAISRLLMTLVVVGVATTVMAKQPNILWLVGENLSHDLGCYGAGHVHTPNLDRLATEGVRFTRAFATNPACAPSRSAFFTGMYQTTIDAHAMRSHRHDDFCLPAGVRPITQRLRDVGYFTANIKTAGGQRVGTGKLDLNYVNEGPIYNDRSDEWETLKSRQPFFAVVNAEESEYDIYDRQSAAKERVEWVGEREHVLYAKPDEVTPPPYYPDHRVVREEWARYLNSVSGMDARFGKVLSQLKADGLEDDTIVIFMGDNGRLEPRGIHWCYDSGLRVPLIIRWPKKVAAPPQFRPGTVDERIVSLIDVTATTIAVAGIERPAAMQGRVFLGERADPPRPFAFAARDRIDETSQRIRSVHDGRYHYLRTFSTGPTFASLNRYKEKCFPIMGVMRELHAHGQLQGFPLELMQRTGPCEELYDTQQDPHEVHNLLSSSRPEHQQALARLRPALDAWIVESGDRGAIPEPASVVAEAAAEMDRWFGTPAWYRNSVKN
ncbi:MAG: sulfatase [Planctomycetes bacterium]|nr:sulfatase [Planctomycetota bacterium]